jgi:hypothetical protein
MGDRYFLTVRCPNCKFEDDDVYFAPTCQFDSWECPQCGLVVDLEQYTGISKESCSNKQVLEYMVSGIKSGGNDEEGS